MNVALALDIVKLVLAEAAIALVAVAGLPRLGIRVPLWALIIGMIAWAAYSLFTSRLAARAMARGLAIGLPDMVGSVGEVVRPLAPEGLVRIKAELWVARSEGGEIETGRKITVVAQQRLKLFVRETQEAGK